MKQGGTTCMSEEPVMSTCQQCRSAEVYKLFPVKKPQRKKKAYGELIKSLGFFDTLFKLLVSEYNEIKQAYLTLLKYFSRNGEYTFYIITDTQIYNKLNSQTELELNNMQDFGICTGKEKRKASLNMQ